MTFLFEPDTGPASWLLQDGRSVEHLLLFGPPVFESYARLRFIPDPAGSDSSEADVRLPEDHPSEICQVRRCLAVLADHTSTPDDCFFALWDGYSTVVLPPGASSENLLELPHRRYALVRGALSDLESWEDAFGAGMTIPPPAFVWPADHRWCLASDVDPHWAGIGGEKVAVDALLAAPEVDVVAAVPTQPQPLYRL